MKIEKQEAEESMLTDAAQRDQGAMLRQVVELARRAGDAVMRIYAHPNPSVNFKRDNSPLTQADLDSHRILCAGLAGIAPGVPILSEESADIPFEVRRAWNRYWLVDPLDGTTEFLKCNGEFTVNVALIESEEPILGVVHAPAIGKTYFAARGNGAHKWENAAVELIKASSHSSAVPTVVVSRRHSANMVQMHADLARIGVDPSRCKFIAMGSSIKFCLIAEGSADLYLRNGPTMEWDTAAAQCVLEVAGGSVTDLHGNRLRYNKPALLNPSFLASATQLIPAAVR